MKRRTLYLAGVTAASLLLLTGYLLENRDAGELPYVYQPDPAMRTIILEAREKGGSLPLAEKYKDLKVIDVHNHDGPHTEFTGPIWDQYHIDKVVLFGAVSEPAAMRDDQLTWRAFSKNPDRYYPFFSGFNIHTPEGIEIVKKNLEQGFMGIGEVIAASTSSPVTSKVAWKGESPMDGLLPEVYRLCAQYQVPILLHMDPLAGNQILYLREALQAHPETKMILAHGNAAAVSNNAALLASLLEENANLYIDFFAGHSAISGDKEIDEYIPVMERFPDRFFLSTDSGYGMNYDRAYEAIYRVIDKLSPDTAVKISHENFERLMEEQTPTQTQRELLKQLSAETGEAIAGEAMNKRMASKLIKELEAKKRAVKK